MWLDFYQNYLALIVQTAQNTRQGNPMQPTNEPTWQTTALKKHMQLELESDAKRNHLLEIQNRLRAASNDIHNAQRDVAHAETYLQFVDRSEAAKKRLAEAEAHLAQCLELKASLTQQAAQIMPSVTAAVALTNACAEVLTNLKIKKD